MLLRPCAKCGKLIPYGKSRCDKCARELEEQLEQNRKNQMRRYNEQRNPKYSRFYKGKQWKILAAKKMQDARYKCQECGRMATEVHHVLPIQTDEGWERRYDETNLKVLCTACHNREHHRFEKKE